MIRDAWWVHVAVAVLGACESSSPSGGAGSSSSPAAPKTSAVVADPPTKVEHQVIQGIGADREIRIAVPTGVSLSIEPAEEESLPRARLRGAGLDITVEAPESGFSSLAEEKGMLSRGDRTLRFDHAAEVGDGFDLIYRSRVASGNVKWATVVSRPVLGANCQAFQLPTSELAHRVLTVCKTMTEAK